MVEKAGVLKLMFRRTSGLLRAKSLFCGLARQRLRLCVERDLAVIEALTERVEHPPLNDNNARLTHDGGGNDCIRNHLPTPVTGRRPPPDAVGSPPAPILRPGTSRDSIRA